MLSISLLAPLLFTTAAAAQEDPTGWVMEPAEAARALPALKEISATDPGGTLLVTQGDEVLHVQAFGLANLSFGIPCTPDTLYRSRGLAQSVIQILALEMAGAGAIDLDTKASAFLPALERVPGNDTLRDLVQLRAKHQDLNALVHFRHRSERGRITRKEAVEILGETRTAADRSNRATNRLVLAAALEAAARKDLGVLLQTYVFGPAGMTSTVYARDHQEIVPGGAQPISWDGTHDRWQAAGSSPLTNQDGHVWLTAKDALIFGRHFTAHSDVPMDFSKILAEGKSKDDLFSPRGVLTVHYPEKDLCITWISGARSSIRDSIPSDIGLYMLGRKAEAQNSLIGIGGGAGGRFTPRRVDYEGTIDTGSFLLPEIGQHLILSEDKRGRLFVSTVGISHARLELLPMAIGAETVLARAEASTVVTDRLTFVELAQMSDAKRREEGFNREGVRRQLTRPSTVTIEFKIVEGSPARPLSVDLDRFLPAPLHLDNLQVERASSLASR